MLSIWQEMQQLYKSVFIMILFSGEGKGRERGNPKASERGPVYSDACKLLSEFPQLFENVLCLDIGGIFHTMNVG